MSDDNLSLCITHLQEMMAQGWTAAAISRESGVNQITIGNIKNGKASRVTDKVYRKIADLKERVDGGKLSAGKPGRKAGSAAVAGNEGATRAAGRTAEQPGRAKQPVKARQRAKNPDALDVQGMIRTDYVPVDIGQLQGLIDGLIARFAGAIEELEQIREQLRK